MFHIFTSAYFYDGSSSSLVVENYCKKYDAPLTYFKNTAPCKLIYLRLTMQFLLVVIICDPKVKFAFLMINKWSNFKKIDAYHTYAHFIWLTKTIKHDHAYEISHNNKKTHTQIVMA